MPVILGILGTAIVGSIIAQGMNDADTAKALRNAVAQYKPEALAQVDEYLKQPLAISSLRAETEAPEAVAAQKNALQKLQQVTEKGYTAEEQAALNRIQQQSAAQAAQQQAALKSQMARRGVAGTGQELAMNLANLGQQSANQYQAGLDVAAQAQRRAFQAMQAQGGLGSQVRQQAYGEAERRAGALDEKNRIAGQRRFDVLDRSLNATTGMEANVNELENRKWGKTGEVATAAAKGVLTGWK